MEMKSERRSLVLLFFILCYQFSLGYYTLYGITKSTSEYFCTQRRADSTDYAIAFNDIEHLETTNLQETSKNISYIALNGEFFEFTRDVEDHKLVGSINHTYYPNGKSLGISQLNFNYKFDDRYYRVTCSLKIRDHIPVYYNGDYNHNSVEYIDVDGFLKRKALRSVYFNVTGQFRPDNFDCLQEKSPETCSVKDLWATRFIQVYGLSIAIIFILCLLNNLSFKSFFVRRLLNRISMIDTGLREYFSFCNPMNGKPIWINEGDDIILVSDQPGFTSSGKCKSLKGFLEECKIIGDQVLYSSKGSKRLIGPFNSEQKEDIMGLFYEMTINFNMCVLDYKQSHFLKIGEVLDLLLSGKYLTRSKKVESGWVLDVHELNMNILTEMFQIKNIHAKFLIEHNQRFFGTLKQKAIEFCLKGKTRYYNRPEDVKNSQWKWYVSDVAKYASEFMNMNLHKQCDWKDSPALSSLKAEGYENIKVIPMTNIKAKPIAEVSCRDIEVFCYRSGPMMLPLNQIKDEGPVREYQLSYLDALKKENISVPGKCSLKKLESICRTNAERSESAAKRMCSFAIMQPVESYDRKREISAKEKDENGRNVKIKKLVDTKIRTMARELLEDAKDKYINLLYNSIAFRDFCSVLTKKEKEINELCEGNDEVIIYKKDIIEKITFSKKNRSRKQNQPTKKGRKAQPKSKDGKVVLKKLPKKPNPMATKNCLKDFNYSQNWSSIVDYFSNPDLEDNYKTLKQERKIKSKGFFTAVKILRGLCPRTSVIPITMREAAGEHIGNEKSMQEKIAYILARQPSESNNLELINIQLRKLQ